jgi:hypothetical protein
MKNKKYWEMSYTPLVPFVGKSMSIPSKEQLKWIRDAKAAT